MVNVLGEQECPGFQGALVLVGQYFPVFGGQGDAAVCAVIGVEDRAAKDAGPQVLDVVVFVEGVFEAAPDPVLFALVEVVHLWGDVGVVEGVLVGLLCFGQGSPGEVGAAGDVAAVQPVAFVQFVADLGVGGKPWVLGEGEVGAAE